MKSKIPYRFSIEFTNHCNFKCKVCPQVSAQYKRDRGYVSDEVFEAFLDAAGKYASCVSIGFFGEQMLHPRFAEYMSRLAENKSYKLVLFSNFSKLRPEMIPPLMECDIVKISTNIEHPDAVSNINKWLEVPNHPRTYLIYVTSSENVNRKQDFLNKWLPVLPKNDGIITKTIITYGGMMSDSYMKPNPCDVLKKPRLMVSWNGDVSICNLDVNMQKKAGNILKSRIGDIVSSRNYKYQIDSVKEKTGICADCFDSNNHRKTKFYNGERDA